MTIVFKLSSNTSDNDIFAQLSNVEYVRSQQLVTFSLHCNYIKKNIVRLTLPTEGKPISATLASPLFITSKPSPFSPFFPDGSNNCDRYLASLALSTPKWYSVAIVKNS